VTTVRPACENDTAAIAALDTSFATTTAYRAEPTELGFVLRPETQNVNPGAVAFYPHVGFRLCGLDLSLYDPSDNPGEFAIFFDREIP
jgi:hypothetical protein